MPIALTFSWTMSRRQTQISQDRECKLLPNLTKIPAFVPGNQVDGPARKVIIEEEAGINCF